MSTPNPTHIDVIAQHQLRDWYPMTGRPVSKSWLCSCGFKDGLQMPCSTADVKRAHAEHVVSKLTDAGYSIVPTDWRPPARVYEDAADVPVRTVIWWPADKTVAARFDKTHGVVLGDDRTFPWSLITGPVTVLFEKGPLGWPTSNEGVDGNGNRYQLFENGSLYWHSSGVTKLSKVS